MNVRVCLRNSFDTIEHNIFECAVAREVVGARYSSEHARGLIRGNQDCGTVACEAYTVIGLSECVSTTKLEKHPHVVCPEALKSGAMVFASRKSLNYL